MFERFTDNCREAVVEAQALSNQMGHGAAQPGHLLLSLATRPGTAADSLDAAGQVRDRMRSEVGRLPPSARSMHLTVETYDTLRRAMIEADVRGQGFVRTGHVLLALLRDAQAVHLRTRAGLDVDSIRIGVTQALAQVHERGARTTALGI